MSISNGKFSLSRSWIFLLKPPLLLLVQLAISYSVYSNDLHQPKETSKEYDPLEKVYLHIDKDFYYPGEDIWFKIYLVTAGDHKLIASSQVVYVDLFSPANRLINSKIYKIKEGCAAGDFKLPLDLIRGQYNIKAYTKFLRNFDDAFIFSKSIFINSRFTKSQKVSTNQIEKKSLSMNAEYQDTKRPDLQFFPEGGHLVESFVNRIGFKVIDEHGNSIALSGTIEDNQGEVLGQFRTSKFGLGLFKLLPKKGRQYTAKVNYNGQQLEYKLPKPIESGVVMEVIDKSEFYQVSLSSSLTNGIDQFWFIGMQRNKVMLNLKVSGNQGAILKVSKKIFDEGIAQLTLYNKNQQAICERLVFVEKQIVRPSVRISHSNKKDRSSEIVELDLHLKHYDSLKTMANLSVSITDQAALKAFSNGLDIKSHLLLNSDLRGEIEQPGYYFNSDDPQRTKILDMLMMTQGWRKYLYNDPMIKNPARWKHAHESGITFSGTVKKWTNVNKPMKAQVSLTYANSQETVYDQVETSSQGRFGFGGYDFSDSTTIIIQAKRFRGKKDSAKKSMYNRSNYIIEIDSLGYLLSPQDTITDNSLIITRSSNGLTSQEMDSIFTIDADVVLLEEMLVEAKKLEQIKEVDEEKKLYREPSNRVSFDKLRNTMPGRDALSILVGRVPGLTVTYNELNEPIVTLRGQLSKGISQNPLFLLDGMPVSVGAIQSIPIDNVDYVDVLKGPKAAIYGSSASNGVIAIYLLDEYKDDINYGNNNRGIISFIHPGYSQAREFYQPVYKNQNIISKQKTAYWNPTLIVADEKPAHISFQSQNVSSTYVIVVEGITSDGKIIRSEQEIISR